MNEPSSSASSQPASDIDAILAVPADFKPVYQVTKVEDVSFAAASRKAIKVSLPEGLDRATLDLNLKQAAKEAYLKDKPDALIIHGYRQGELNDAPYTVGMLTFAPYGDWSRAKEKPGLDKYQAVIEVRDDYFQPKKAKAAQHDKSLEKQALAGDYQAQRNLAFSLSSGFEGYQQDPVEACAWRIVILKSEHSEADASDTNNKDSDCERKLSPEQLSEAEARADALLKKIKRR